MNKIIIHYFNYFDKSIPVYFDSEYIKDTLDQLTTIIDLIRENSDIVSKINNKEILANESLYSSYIEGYESYLTTDMIINGEIYAPASRADKAVTNCYSAYNKMLEINDMSSINSIVKIWRKMIKSSMILYRNTRLLPVVVGNSKGIVHRGLPVVYVRKLMKDMIHTVDNFKSTENDKYNLLSGIVAHYLFTYIHPFLDGNGRTGRLYQQFIIHKNSGLEFYLPFSSGISEEKKFYYASFRKANVTGDINNITELDISEFIKFNLYSIMTSLLKLYKSLKGDRDSIGIQFEDADIHIEYRNNKLEFCKELLNDNYMLTVYDSEQIIKVVGDNRS
ncbi:MAG: Fic family protein [Lachnospiraceae bacterium]|nr:Fic family protein [Lachnospiraceae bacterium]